MANAPSVIVGKPPNLAPLVQANRFLAPVWFPFFQSLADAATAAVTAQTALTALQASVASDEAAIAALQTAGGASGASLAALEAALAALAAEHAPASGNLTEATSDVLTIVGGTSAVLGAGASIQVAKASATADGYLSAADWTAFHAGGAAATHAEILCDSHGAVTQTSGDFIYVIGVPN